MMSASSPASTVSNISYLAPLSSTTTTASTYSSESHSSTCTTCSYPSTSSYSTSVYTVASSAASTLCNDHHPYPGHVPQPKERSRRIGMRKFIRWSLDQPSGEISSTVTLADTNSSPKTDMFSPTTLSSTTGLRGAKSAFFQPRDGPTLKELSSRKTRYYDKRGIPIAPSGGATPSGRGRNGPKKVDAKALFSNERTYMHWIKFGLLVGTMALNLISFGHSVGLQVGMFLVLVAMSTLVYATTVFHLRHGWMAKMRQDVLYYDRIGPSVLFAALFLAYATNVACKFSGRFLLFTMRTMVSDITEENSLTYFDMDKGPLDI
ncbi:hypothetical protein BGZ59_002997 [Podila verticillata]|nr:hypothetical protein BGZ59_002997 [Podila verticillata]